MKYKLKCMVSTVLTLSLTATSIIFPIHIKAEENTSPNIAILEQILNGDRQFVIDTLINENRSTNPHAKLMGIANEKSMMREVLSRYCDKNDPNYNALYKLCVDAMITWCNKDDYINDIADTVTGLSADLVEEMGGSEQAVSFLDGCVSSSKSSHYDNILQSVLSADYTSSSGQTVSGSDAQLTNIRRIADGVNVLKNFNSFLKSSASADQDTAETTTAYLNNVLIPAAESYENVMNSFAKVTGTTLDNKENCFMEFSKAMAIAAVYDSNVISTETAGEKITTIAPQYLLDEGTIEIIKLNNNMSKFASNSIDSYLYLRAIQTQKETVAGVMKRTSANISDTDSANLLKNYAKLIENASDTKTSAYEWVIKMLKDEEIVSGYVDKKMSEGMTSLARRLIPLYDESIIPSELASLTGIISTTINLGDRVTGAKNTALKTFELKKLDELINCFIATYNSDLNAYKKNKTDENAAKVLDDLSFIQRMRLRGETIAYNMTIKQLTSPLGQLLSGGFDSTVYYSKHYQDSIDTLIGASVMPIVTDEFVVNNGEKVTLMNDQGVGIYAKVEDNDGNSYNIAEIMYRIPSGINVLSSGELSICSGALQAVPYIKNSGGTVILDDSTPLIGEYQQNGGTLEINRNNKLQINDLYISGGTISSSIPNCINSNRFEQSGELTPENISIKISDTAKFDGTIHGNIVADGEITGSGMVDNLTISGSGTQNLDGSITAGNLTYANTGTVNQNGTIHVTGMAQNATSKVNNGQNTVIKSTGDISGAYYNSSVTLDGTTLSSGKTINGSLLTKNTVNTGDITVLGMLKQTSGTLNLNGDTTAKTDAYFSGTVNQNNSAFYAYGDISGSNVTLGNVTMCGKSPQTIGSAITVRDFHNKSKKLTVGNTVIVNGSIRSESPPVNGKNIKLTSSASFGDTYYKGDITVNGLSGSLPKNLYGRLYLTGDIMQSGNSSVNSMEHSGGTLMIANGELTVKGLLINSDSSANVVLNDNATLTSKGDTSIKGMVSGNGTFNVCGDLYNNGTGSIENLNITANAPLTVSGNTLTVTNLNIFGNEDVTLSSKINISERYSGNNHLINPENVVYTNGNTAGKDITYNEPLNVTGDLIIDGYTVTAHGLSVTNGDIILTNGAKLIVNGKTNISGSSNNIISIDETSSIELNKLSFIKNIGSVEVNGKLKFGSDISLSSTTISGSGAVTANGDIYGSSLTINKPKNFNITGKTPQSIQCSGANFDNLTVNNPCKSGITFSGTVYCHGALNTGNTKINGTITQK